MCGIAGLVTGSLSPVEVQASISLMTDAIAHRGPDDSGAWVSPPLSSSLTVALGHRRLAIVDLSPLGHQPMESSSGRFVTVFNGEIYNFQDLREELRQEGREVSRGSDTAVLLEAFEQWGIEAALRKANGMFAIAVWDRQEELLTLARDRLGKKPLYYGWNSGAFLFGSELRALMAFPQWDGELRQASIEQFLQFGHIPAPYSILSGIFKLPPAHLVTLTPEQLAQDSPPLIAPESVVSTGGRQKTSGKQVFITPYWALPPADPHAAEAPQKPTTFYTQELRSLLEHAVSQRMIADVPIGSFLSGGVDSSLVTAMMQRCQSTPVHTFSLGFEDPRYDESLAAAEVATSLGTKHTSFRVDDQTLQGIVPRVSQLYDEPFADPSQLPTYLVSAMARERVTVVLTGEGGDEVFLGYNRYQQPERVLALLSSIPSPLQAAAAHLLGSPIAEYLARLANSLLPSAHRIARPEESIKKLHRLYRTLIEASQAKHGKDRSSGLELLYQLLMTLPAPATPLLRSATSPIGESLLGTVPAHLPFAERASRVDLLRYLPDDILAKVDRATMAVALEARSPLLDHKIVEWATALPASIRMKGGERKYLLKELLSDYLPRALIERPKMGFSVPIGPWLRGPLRPWAEALLQPVFEERNELLKGSVMREIWDAHQQGSDSYAPLLWAVLVLLDWLRAYEGKYRLGAEPSVSSTTGAPR